MAPHRALFIPEIALEIFQTLDIDDIYDDDGHRGTLASLAVSCKMLSSVALDVLWRRMDSLLPILKILPSFQLFDGIYILQRTSPHHFTRFDHYARRIREFILTRQTIPINPPVLARLLQLRNPTPLFPGLRSLIWRGYKTPGIESMLFLSPSLRSVKFSELTDVSGAASFLHALVDETPLLEKLDLQWMSFKSSTVSLVCRFQHLRSLSVVDSGPFLHSKDFIRLSSLQNLESLHISLHNDSSPESFTADGGSYSITFPSLGKLSLQGHPAHIVTFLGGLTAPSLWSISMVGRFKVNIVPAQWCACFQLIASRFCHSLRSLHAYDPTNWSPGPAIVRWFESLLALPKLEDLDLAIPGLDIASDADAHDFASALPALRQLSLSNLEAPSLPTMASFQSFATLCPGLTHLALSVTADALPDIDSTPLMTHDLRTLVIWAKTISNPTATARYLDRLFPSLHSIDHCDEADSCSCSCKCKQLNDSLRMFQDIRADAYKRINATKPY